MRLRSFIVSIMAWTGLAGNKLKWWSTIFCLGRTLLRTSNWNFQTRKAFRSNYHCANSTFSPYSEKQTTRLVIINALSTDWRWNSTKCCQRPKGVWSLCVLVNALIQAKCSKSWAAVKRWDRNSRSFPMIVSAAMKEVAWEWRNLPGYAC